MNQNPLGFASFNKVTKVDFRNILGISGIWTIMVILVNPIGDFPLNDDWAYGRAVQSVIEKGDFQLLGWTATNLFSQVYWGALFCLPFGFSFTALRFSTLTLGLIGVLVTYSLFREVDSSPKISFLGALLVAINPLYFELSNTFMNDVPSFTFAILSFYFLLRGLKHDSTIESTIGVLFSCVAILTRQLGLVIPLAFGCAYLTKKGGNIQTFVKGFSPALLGLAVQIIYQKWLQLTIGLPASHGKQIKTLLEELSMGLEHSLSNFTKITLASLIYLGLFIFPFLLILYSRKFKEFSSRERYLSLFALSAFFVAVISVLNLRHKLMPLMGNVLIDFGLGPVGFNSSELPKATPILWICITAIGVVGATLLLQYLFLAIRRIFVRHSRYEYDKKKWLIVFIASAVGIYFFPLGFLGVGHFGFYDRYLIFLLPLLMMLVSVLTLNASQGNVSHRFIYTTLIITSLYGVFTIGATHDYLSVNRSGWQALDNLMQESQILPHRINGGFEFNGWYLCSQSNSDSDKDSLLGSDFDCLWGDDNDDYTISLTPITGYEEVKRYPLRRWLPFGPKNIFVLQKKVPI